MKYTRLAYLKHTSKVPSPEVEFSFSMTGKSSLPFDLILPHWTSPGNEELDSSWSSAKKSVWIQREMSVPAGGFRILSGVLGFKN